MNGASIIICAYSAERWDALQEAVHSVLSQTPAPSEVIVVVDHNTALRQRAEEAFDGVKVMENEQETGLSGARNTGLFHATGDVVVFLDDDARARPGWLHSITLPFASAKIVGTGGVAVPAWQTDRPGWLPDEFLWVVGCSYRGLPATVAPIRNPIGASMAFRREPCLVTAGFAHGIGRVGNTPLGCEETEFAIRLRAADTEAMIVQVPDAIVDHLVTPERAQWSYFRARCWAEGLSKAVVARLVGDEAGLSSERAYVMRTLPLGVLRGLLTGARGRPDGFRQAAAIVLGLAITSAGFLWGKVSLGSGAPA